MGRKNTLHTAIRAIIIANPAASVSDIVEKTGASPRTVQYVRSILRAEGILEPSKRSEAKSEGSNNTEKSISESLASMLNIENVKDMASDPTFGVDLLDEDQIRAKLLQQVQILAFDPRVGTQTRLDAIQVWVKLKDIARSATLGPGNPLIEEDAIDRLVNIMQGCGPSVVIKALDRAFPKKGEYDGTPERTSDTSEPEKTTNTN